MCVELVPRLGHWPEGTVPAGPFGESCARESVHSARFTEHSSGKLCFPFTLNYVMYLHM